MSRPPQMNNTMHIELTDEQKMIQALAKVAWPHRSTSDSGVNQRS